jgi:alpha-D-ribose 1-methylphosphonate 5-triphosphate synthase subunit PhnG
MEREEINFVFQFADLVQLEKLYNKIDKELGVNVINQPTSQTLLVPIKDPLSGGEFYAGEALVTSCIVEVDKVYYLCI